MRRDPWIKLIVVKFKTCCSWMSILFFSFLHRGISRLSPKASMQRDCLNIYTSACAQMSWKWRPTVLLYGSELLFFWLQIKIFCPNPVGIIHNMMHLLSACTVEPRTWSLLTLIDINTGVECISSVSRALNQMNRLLGKYMLRYSSAWAVICWQSHRLLNAAHHARPKCFFIWVIGGLAVL